MAQRFDFSPFELQITKKEKRGALWNAIIGLAALIFAWFHLQLLASLCYILIPVVMIINERRHKGSLA